MRRRVRLPPATERFFSSEDAHFWRFFLRRRSHDAAPVLLLRLQRRGLLRRGLRRRRAGTRAVALRRGALLALLRRRLARRLGERK